MALKLSKKKAFSETRGGGEQTMSILPALDGAARRGGGDAGFGQYPVARQLRVLVAALLGVLLIIGILVYRDNRATVYEAAYIAAAGELRMLSQRLAKASSLALQGGGPAAFQLLSDSNRKFMASLERLRSGGEIGTATVPPSPENAAPQLENLAAKWDITRRNVEQMLKAQARMALFGEYLAAYGSETPPRAPAAGDIESQRIAAELDAAFRGYRAAVGGALAALPDLAAARQAGKRIIDDSETLLDAADQLASAYQSRSTERTIYEASLAVLILLALAVLAMMARVYIEDARRQAEYAERSRRESEMVNRQNQDAILRLMNELGDLADGDLTVTATVSEDITGAIADSINYTIEELRVLVGRINDAASRVTGATETAQRTSVELLDAARRQSREIQEAWHSILEAASSMTRASGDADQSAQVARHSLAAAGKGTQAVQDSIKGMNEIREQIQETSKRIKRLGESSQEIGEIVELVSDITEQTNVLALNAAIQAASAGEAGRGFTVVAEEVQRLAERSGEATKQIAAIVKTIQTDTQGAVSAMEKSTRGVVEGTKLSDAAGQALSEIGAVSQNLAELIERISQATRLQADAATGVAGKMREILKVTEQTTAGTQKTASAVGELAGLATELKGSVAGFKVG
ncbi:MAG: methyl-accepting chemotaxis protein [Candidatus Accumulibacter sp.]|jgi:twitching motility protein PilJ|nr:methyl-accepting chemotaxis protein [Accumulibacter sp.]